MRRSRRIGLASMAGALFFGGTSAALAEVDSPNRTSPGGTQTVRTDLLAQRSALAELNAELASSSDQLSRLNLLIGQLVDTSAATDAVGPATRAAKSRPAPSSHSSAPTTADPVVVSASAPRSVSPSARPVPPTPHPTRTGTPDD